eukprot:TRINITY_DN8401_c0_g1_i1.p1 TRINITY_DN8401_c0_g1~~TRINITY_DN8401_c0_g1_i1.p1  ORF type:complete len:554 (+),score=76.08 TRINITY_DN8401_c0_g1_i1:35-1663(+)
MAHDRVISQMVPAKTGDHNIPFSESDFHYLLGALRHEHERSLAQAGAEIDSLKSENELLRTRVAALDPKAAVDDPGIAAKNQSSDQPMSSEEHLLMRAVQGGQVDNQDPEIDDALPSNENKPAATSLDSHHKESEDLAARVPGVPRGTMSGLAVVSEGLTSRQKFSAFLLSPRFDACISIVLCFNLAVMAIELQLTGLRSNSEGPSDADWPQIADVLWVLNMLFNIVFAVEVVIRICFLGLLFWRSCLNYVDFFVSAVTVIDLSYNLDDLPVSPLLFRMIRFGKVARTFRILALSARLESFGLLVKCLLSSLDVLSWASLFLFIIQALAAIVFSILVQDYLQRANSSEPAWDEIYRHYGTYTRSFFTMFEIMFANWGPTCRLLMDNISESFSLAFIAYRCVAGVAVLNVVNSIFVSQTLKFAVSDEDYMAKRLVKEQNAHRRKLEMLFANADVSDDGLLSREEFAALLGDDHMKLWLNQLGLEYHDLVELFDLIDDGDGRMNWEEFLNGSKMLKGGAKSIDVFRLETKVDKFMKTQQRQKLV